MRPQTVPVFSSSGSTSKQPGKKKKIFLVAGEPSGDALAAKLVHALKQKTDVEFTGVGGPALEEEGVHSLYPMEDLAVMGVVEVLPRLPNLVRRINETVEAVGKSGAHALITVDSQDFSYRVARRVKKKYPQVKCIHYVAPTVWAWRPGRAKMVSKFLDHLLALYPFEPPYFEQHGLPCSFVGHPVIETDAARGSAERFRNRYGLSPDQPVMCLLPGSRRSELDKLLPVFVRTAERFLSRTPGIQIVLPTLPYLKETVKSGLGRLADRVILTETASEKYDAFAASTVALAASGTVTLELAMARLPHVIAYKVNAFSALFAPLVLKTPYFNLVNIALKEEIVPEMLQKRCTPELLGNELSTLMENGAARAHQIAAFDQVVARLGGESPQPPSIRAAEAVLKVIEAAV